MFAIWGLGGLLVALFAMMGLWTEHNGLRAVAMATYTSCGLLFWIGGMLFFGLADLMAKIKPE